MSLAMALGGILGNVVVPGLATAVGVEGAMLAVAAVVLLGAGACVRLPHSTRDEAAIAAEADRRGRRLTGSKRAGHTAALGSTHGGPLRRLPPRAAWDEMFGGPGSPAVGVRRRCSPSLQPIDGEELAARADQLSQTLPRPGVTFAHAGEERPFPLDLVPRVIGAEEWAVIERGRRRSGCCALEAFLADVYGAGQVFADGVVPAQRSSPPARTSTGRRTGSSPPNGVRVHVSGIDLVRDEDGDFRVLEDNLRIAVGRQLRASRTARR